MLKNETGGQAKELLYMRIAGNIEQQILKDVLRVGDRLPSLRQVARDYGVSLATSLQSYYHLESKSLITARPQSGYFVSYSPKRFPDVPSSSSPTATAGNEDITDIIQKVYYQPRDSEHTMLSLGVPEANLLPVAKLNKGLVNATRTLKDSGIMYEETQGNEKLRRQIVRCSLAMEADLDYRDMVITSGCVDAIASCLMVLTQRGDTLAVESPVSFGMLQLAQNLGLKVIELPTDPQTGVAPETLEKILKSCRIDVLLLISNFSNPLGSCMPDSHKKEIVRLIEKYNIPLIENDLYGDLYFGSNRPKSCKTYDKTGMVLWCGSVSKTLAPGYRVGWVSPGKFKDRIMQLKIYHAIAAPAITQEVIADFLETGRYEAHLRKLRNTLHGNSLKYSGAIARYFPEGTRASRPLGGTMIWVELPDKTDTLVLFEKAMKQKISIAPGRLFTLQKQFDNCMRLNFAVAWNGQIERSLKILGTLATALT